MKVHTNIQRKLAGAGLALAVLVSASPAWAATVATFSDPAVDGSTPLFAAGGGTLSGGWTGAGLNLDVPIAGMSFADAVFDMAPITVNPDDTVGAGSISFYEDAAMTMLILQIDFDGGVLIEPLEFGASFVATNDVTFSGPVITTALANEQFTFSFANPVVGQNSTTYTASFTSSAVPEPGTLVLAFAGALCLMRRKR
jgi:hypothetical protein